MPSRPLAIALLLPLLAQPSPGQEPAPQPAHGEESTREPASPARPPGVETEPESPGPGSPDSGTPAPEVGPAEGTAESASVEPRPVGESEPQEEEETPEGAEGAEGGPQPPAESEPQEEGQTPEEGSEEEGATPEGGEREAESTAPQLSPEEQAAIEEAKRRREERRARREAKRAEEEAKQAAKLAREIAKREERLAGVLAKGYELLEAGELEKARQTFQNHLDEHRGHSFESEMALARTRLAMEAPALAVEHAVRAFRDAGEAGERAEALAFAAEATLAARPLDEASSKPLPGTEMYVEAALRYYLRSLTADPTGAEAARSALEARFPTPEDEATERLYARYLEIAPEGPARHARRLAATYEALLSGTIEGYLAVAGGVTAPARTHAPRPPYPKAEGEESVRRRLVAGLLVEADGTVSRAEVLNGVDEKLDRKAAKTFESWTFEPARLPGGHPVPVHYVVAVNADTTPQRAGRERAREGAAEEVGRRTGEEGTAGAGRQETDPGASPADDADGPPADDPPADDPPADDPPADGPPAGPTRDLGGDEGGWR